MTFRTLVKSGNTSFVVSLPIEWVRENKLEAGDTINLSYGTNGHLLITPQELKEGPKVEETCINIDEKDIHDLRNEIISAYIDDFKNIRLVGKEIKDKSVMITEIIQGLIALDVIEHTPQHIIARNFFDYKDTSASMVLKKEDIIIRAMLVEIKNFFQKGLRAKDYEEINNLNEQINKLNLLAMKVTKKALTDPNIAKMFELNYLEIMLTSKINFFLENISHHLKSIAQDLVYLDEKKKTVKSLEEVYFTTEKIYLEMMNNHHQKNLVQMSKLVKEEKEIMERIDNIHRVNDDLLVGKVLENMKVIHEYLIRMTKLCLSF